MKRTAAIAVWLAFCVALACGPAPVMAKASFSLPAQIVLEQGQRVRLQPQKSADTGQKKQKWTSSKSKVAKVDKDGVVVAVKPGNAVITLTIGKEKAKTKVTVVKAQKPVQTAVTIEAVRDEILRLMNQERAPYGAPILMMDETLNAAAQIRAAEITSFFSHTRPDGSDCFTVSNKAFGENIGMFSINASQTSEQLAARIMKMWMESPGHKANILRERFNTVGIGYMRSGNAYFFVQLFGL